MLIWVEENATTWVPILILSAVVLFAVVAWWIDSLPTGPER
jgi:hypothetical protein